MTPQIEEFIAGLSADARIVELLAASLGRVLAKTTPPDFDPGSLDAAKVAHVVDWLTAAVVNEEPWLAVVDPGGRPKKLMKFGTVEAVYAEADKAMRKAIARTGVIVVEDEDLSVYRALDDGYTLVRMRTPKALTAESSAMGHCVGHGSYNSSLERGDVFLSLRDRHGKSHATIHIDADGASVRQIQGRQNRMPLRKYLELMRPALLAWRTADIPLNRLGFLIGSDGSAYGLDDLPERLTVRGSVKLEGTQIVTLPRFMTVEGDLNTWSSGLSRLPDDLHVTGKLTVGRGSKTDLTRLPARLRVDGELDISRSRITELPDDLRLGGDLVMARTAVESLPPGLDVKGKLDVSECRMLRRLPAGLKVGGRLEAAGTRFETLPDGLDIDTLNITESRIRRLPSDIVIRGDILADGTALALPDGLTVGGKLQMRGASVKALPRGLHVKGSLDIHGSKIADLPADLRVDGSVEIGKTGIEDLPDWKSVGGRLDVSRTRIEHLPEGLRVEGDLLISRSRISVLPTRLVVAGSLMADRSRLVSLPNDAEIGKDIVLSGSPVTALPDGLAVKGTLALKGTRVERLPRGLAVEETLDISGTAIAEIPEGTRMGSLNASHSRLVRLPDDIREYREVIAVGSSLRWLPDGLRVREKLDLKRTPVRRLPRGMEAGIVEMQKTEIRELPSDLRVREYVVHSAKPRKHAPSPFTPGDHTVVLHYRFPGLVYRMSAWFANRRAERVGDYAKSGARP